VEALYYKKENDLAVQCQLCPHHCHIQNGKTGFCRTRKNEGGTLLALNYGQCTALALDPVEKKPLYHFHPGSQILSAGSWGCNLTCSFCQNWHISQGSPPWQELPPRKAAELARSLQERGNIGLAYTYNEPSVTYEWIYETAPLIHEAGLYNVMVTNGYIEETPLQSLLPYIDAWNIDLKSWNDDFYRQICQGTISPVLRTIEKAVAVSHVEITCLILPGINDSPDDMDSLASWLASIRPDIPLHITRYFPRYHCTLPPTPVETLKMLQRTAGQYISHVYVGNV
jgi:pyruvate formate lyase activating enzyme